MTKLIPWKSDMQCPKCGAIWKWPLAHCRDCDVSLVRARPAFDPALIQPMRPASAKGGQQG